MAVLLTLLDAEGNELRQQSCPEAFYADAVTCGWKPGQEVEFSEDSTRYLLVALEPSTLDDLGRIYVNTPAIH